MSLWAYEWPGGTNMCVRLRTLGKNTWFQRAARLVFEANMLQATEKFPQSQTARNRQEYLSLKPRCLVRSRRMVIYWRGSLFTSFWDGLKPKTDRNKASLTSGPKIEAFLCPRPFLPTISCKQKWHRRGGSLPNISPPISVVLLSI